jgi:hypothetical protein
MCAEASVSKMDNAKAREPIRSEIRKSVFQTWRIFSRAKSALSEGMDSGQYKKEYVYEVLHQLIV